MKPLTLMALLGAIGCAFAGGYLAFKLAGPRGAEEERAVFSWRGGMPTLMDVDGDGLDDVIGNGEGGMLFALDGKTWKKRWQIKSDGGAMVAGNKLAVLEGWYLLMLDPRTGNELSREKKSDRITDACFADGVLWTYALDEIVTGVNLETGAKLTAPKLPCARPRTYGCGASEAKCKEGDGRYDLSSGEDHIELAIKKPGSPLVTMIGRGADGKERFRQIIDEQGSRIQAVDLAEGRFYFVQLATLRVFDARTGQLLFAQPLQSSCDWMAVHRGRLYLAGTGHRNYKRLTVYDAATGTKLAQLGG